MALIPDQTPMPMFSIVIPTRARARTLREAIPTVLEQSDGDLELVIQDNASSSDTRTVVEGFSDPRIVYRRSDHLLAMHDNWEAALEATRGEWILFIGDDDALLPNACAEARRIIGATDARLLCWVTAVYGWPCHAAAEFRNLLSIQLGQGWEELPSRTALQGLYARSSGWVGLPSIYHGFVHRSVIDTVRKRTGGRYFVDLQPDIGATLANLFCCDRYVRCLEPLSVSGWSGHSNGGRAPTPEGMRAMLERLAAEASQSMASWTVLTDPRLAGMETMMLGTLAGVRSALGVEGDLAADTPIPANERDVLSHVMRAPGGITVPFETWREAVLEHAARLNLDVPPETLIPPPPSRRRTGLDVDGQGCLRQIQLDADRFGCIGLRDAVRQFTAILHAYRLNPSPVRTSHWPPDPALRRGV